MGTKMVPFNLSFVESFYLRANCGTFRLACARDCRARVR